MTTHAMRPGSTARSEVESETGRDLLGFAAVLLGVVGFFNLLDGIAAINRSRIFVNNTLYVVGDLRSWGWVVAILGGLQILAALGVAMRSEAARYFALLIVSLNALGQMFFIPAYPFWSLMIIAVDVVVLYALAASGRRETVRD